VSLLNILKLSLPSQGAYFDALISRCISVAEPVRRKDRAGILARFAARRSEFSRQCESELATIGIEDRVAADSYVCVKCHRPIDPAVDIFGINCTGVNFEFCPHYVHESCFEDSCCICATILAPYFIPILLPGFTARQQSAAREAIHQLPNISDSLRRVGQVLDLENSTTISPEIVHVLQSVIFSGLTRSDEGKTDDPLLDFALLLPSATSQSSFEAFAGRFRENSLFSLKGAQILWNCFVGFGDNSGRFTAFDLSQVREIPTDLYIEKLPERFTDLFLGESGVKIVALADYGPVCCCLTCGAFFTLGMDEHSRPDLGSACNGRTILVLMGEIATAVLCTTETTEGSCHIRPPIYLSEYGDSSIGFDLGCPLFLSQQQRNDCLKHLITNSDLSIRLG
jgi:hypothetical protein